DDAVVLASIPDDLEMDFRHQRTGRVNDSKIANSRFFSNFRRYAVCAEDGHRAVWNFVETIYEDCSLGSQLIDHKPVVNDLFANVHWPPQLLKCECHDVDGPNDACAKSAGTRQQNSPMFHHNRTC